MSVFYHRYKVFWQYWPTDLQKLHFELQFQLKICQFDLVCIPFFYLSFLHDAEYKVNHSTINAFAMLLTRWSLWSLHLPCRSVVRPSERIANSYAREAPCANWNIYFQGQHVKRTCWARHFSDLLLLLRSPLRHRLRGSSCKTLQMCTLHEIFMKGLIRTHKGCM